MAFEVFTETGARSQEFVSVTETKSFGLSRAFVDKNGITKAHKAVILFDPDTQQVGLHFTLTDTKVGFAVRLPNPKHGAAIMARSFFEVKGIDAKRFAGRYEAIEKKRLRELGINKDGEAFIVTLKEKVKKHNNEQAPGHGIVEDDKPIDLSQIEF